MTATRIGYVPPKLQASSGRRAEGAPITIRRGDDLGLVSPLRSFEQVAPYCTRRILSQSATLYENPVQGFRRTKHKIESPLNDHLLILSTSNAFNFFLVRLDEIRSAFDPPKFVD